MLSLIYVSSAKRLFSDEELLQLLQQSRDKNAGLAITGMLLYKDGNFMQVLEGPEKAVRELYATISNDQRHHGVICLLEENVVERQFPDWTMGFRNLAYVNVNEVPGYSDFLGEPLNSPLLRTNPTRAQKLLLMFREKM